MFAPEGANVHAVTSGKIVALKDSSKYGVGLFLRDSKGNTWGYIHLRQGFAEGIKVGTAVEKGELLGFVGGRGPGLWHSPPHLHLQVKDTKGHSWNPYSMLVEMLGGPADAPKVESVVFEQP